MSSKFTGRGFGMIWFGVGIYCLLCAFPFGAMSQPTFFGPLPYLTFTNSTFDVSGYAYFFLETLEDGLLNVPGVSVNGLWHVNNPNPYADSVDADDGFVGGSGVDGHSLLSERTETNLTVTFDAGSLGGHLPTRAGLVCTDVGDVLFGPFGIGNFTFSARDAQGVLLGSVTFTNFGNGSAFGNTPGATAEDRFVGVDNPGGISSISLTANNSKDWEVDHLQYGYVASELFVPELRIQRGVPDEVVLSWSTNAIGFVLQETLCLPATNWTIVTTPPVIVGDELQVTVTPLSSNRFYRLINQ